MEHKVLQGSVLVCSECHMVHKIDNFLANGQTMLYVDRRNSLGLHRPMKESKTFRVISDAGL